MRLHCGLVLLAGVAAACVAPPAPAPPTGLSRDEQAVYRAALRDRRGGLYADPAAFVGDSSAADAQFRDFWGRAGADSTLFADLRTKLTRPVPLPPAVRMLLAPTAVLDAAHQPPLSRTAWAAYWRDLGRRYPDSTRSGHCGIQYLSPVGFNRTHTQALVLLTELCATSRHATTWLLDRQDTTWVVRLVGSAIAE